MAPAQARAVQADVGTVLLYTPVVAPEDFDVAVSYLIRRLEENAAEENFLHALFSAPESESTAPSAPAADAGASEAVTPVRPESTPPAAMLDQERRFRASVGRAVAVPVGARRSTERPEITEVFANTADSDPALPATRAWARSALARDAAGGRQRRCCSRRTTYGVRSRPPSPPRPTGAPDPPRSAPPSCARRPGSWRRAVVQLVTVMAAEGGKTVAESDPEVSEAIDFARYYADRALDLQQGLSVTVPSSRRAGSCW